jgi:hypothetical protein
MPVQILDVADPNNDQVDMRVIGVTQDEPVNFLGDGDTLPDAVVNNNRVLLRAERSGNGNGRVYHITFSADDDSGENCVGTVTVCVPHDIRTSTCVDDGPQYNSFQP